MHQVLYEWNKCDIQIYKNIYPAVFYIADLDVEVSQK